MGRSGRGELAELPCPPPRRRVFGALAGHCTSALLAIAETGGASVVIVCGSVGQQAAQPRKATSEVRRIWVLCLQPPPGSQHTWLSKKFFDDTVCHPPLNRRGSLSASGTIIPRARGRAAATTAWPSVHGCGAGTGGAAPPRDLSPTKRASHQGPPGFCFFLVSCVDQIVTVGRTGVALRLRFHFFSRVGHGEVRGADAPVFFFIGRALSLASFKPCALDPSS